ncbi:hypothetical protein [Sneathiella limimaris]|uniref:hypothetical protein n=1 Tax=Sneathiella limimaris TaxID=1964213 RepID=UPI00146BA718|nr:hypothetical protein [Sneathiella limimaris]
MGHQFYFDREAGAFFVKYGEVLNKDIIIGASKEINALPDIWPGIPVHVDFRDCKIINLSSDDTREIAEFMAKHNDRRGQFKIAQLVSSKLMFGTSRMTSATIDQAMIEIGIFEDPKQSLEYIGLPADYQLPF